MSEWIATHLQQIDGLQIRHFVPHPAIKWAGHNNAYHTRPLKVTQKLLESDGKVKMLNGPTRSYSVLRDRSLGPDRTDRGPRSQRPIKTAYFKNFKPMISHHPVIVERRNTAHWIRHDETRRMVVIAYF